MQIQDVKLSWELVACNVNPRHDSLAIHGNCVFYGAANRLVRYDRTKGKVTQAVAVFDSGHISCVSKDEGVCFVGGTEGGLAVYDIAAGEVRVVCSVTKGESVRFVKALRCGDTTVVFVGTTGC